MNKMAGQNLLKHIMCYLLFMGPMHLFIIRVQRGGKGTGAGNRVTIHITMTIIQQPTVGHQQHHFLVDFGGFIQIRSNFDI